MMRSEVTASVPDQQRAREYDRLLQPIAGTSEGTKIQGNKGTSDACLPQGSLKISRSSGAEKVGVIDFERRKKSKFSLLSSQG